jgi:rhodanese-related sulfurtransferase
LPLLAAGGDKIMDAAITPAELSQRLAAFPPPTLVDVRRQTAFEQDPTVIPTALRRLPEAVEAWASALEPWREVVVYCVRGHEVSQSAAAELRLRGLDARYVEGGLERWRAEGRESRPFRAATRWVTRERPKIDRIACPWLVRRFIDPSAEFFYVPDAGVRAFAAANAATPYDVPDVDYTHVGPECSFDAFIRRHALSHPALDALAAIVRAADTATLDRAAQAPGLLAASLGLSAMFADDHAMLKWGMLVYDSLYAWCRRCRQTGQTETHGWYPEELSVRASS